MSDAIHILPQEHLLRSLIESYDEAITLSDGKQYYGATLARDVGNFKRGQKIFLFVFWEKDACVFIKEEDGMPPIKIPIKLHIMA